MKINSTLRINAYDVISRAVEEGVEHGIRRAHKHNDNPSETDLGEAIQMAVLNALCEVLVFE